MKYANPHLRSLPPIERLRREAVRHPVCGGWTSPDRNRGIKGYLGIYFNGRLHRVHRVVWEHVYGPIPEGMLVCHSCDQPDCYDPTHLFLGTNADNSADMVAKGRNRGASGEDHPGAKLTWDDVAAIRKEYAGGLFSQQELARRYGVGQTAISNIILQKRWKS